MTIRRVDEIRHEVTLRLHRFTIEHDWCLELCDIARKALAEVERLKLELISAEEVRHV